MALLFLVRNKIPTEPIWAAFIAAAAELTLKLTVPPTAPADPHLFPSSREATGAPPMCRGHYLAPPREKEPPRMTPPSSQPPQSLQIHQVHGINANYSPEASQDSVYTYDPFRNCYMLSPPACYRAQRGLRGFPGS